MSSTTKVERADIPEYPTPVVSHCRLLRSQFMEEGDAHMNDYLVTEAKLYKSVATSRHEYISLKVQGPKKKVFYIAIERARGSVLDKVDKKDDPNAKDPYDNDDNYSDARPASDSSGRCTPNQPNGPLAPQTDAATTRSRRFFSSPSPSPSVASLDKFTRMRKADDVISVLSSTGMHATTDQVFRTLIFSPAVPLCEVALLGSTLHRMRRYYLLFSDNCYYYAGTIIKILEEKYEPTLAVETTGSAALDEKFELKKMKKNQAGKWYGIPVYDKEDVDTAPVIAQFEQNLTSFRNSVDDAAKKRRQQEKDREALKVAEAETARVRKEAEEERKVSDARIARLQKELEEAKMKK